VAVTICSDEFVTFVMTASSSNKYMSAALLCAAAADDDVAGLRRLVGQHGICVHQGDYDNRTALHLAASAGCFSSVQCLLEELHCAVSPVDRWGHTPLDGAKRGRHEIVVRYLLANGALSGAHPAQSAPCLKAEGIESPPGSLVSSGPSSPDCEREDRFAVSETCGVEDDADSAPPASSILQGEAAAQPLLGPSRKDLETKAGKIARLRGSLMIPTSHTHFGVQSLSCSPIGASDASPDFSGCRTPPILRPTRNFRKKSGGRVRWAEELEQVKEFSVLPTENDLDKLRRALCHQSSCTEMVCAQNTNPEETSYVEAPQALPNPNALEVSSSEAAAPLEQAELLLRPATSWLQPAPMGSNPSKHEVELTRADSEDSIFDPPGAAGLALMAAAHRAATARGGAQTKPISALDKLRLSLGSPMPPPMPVGMA
jgi:hypothetical protein